MALEKAIAKIRRVAAVLSNDRMAEVVFGNTDIQDQMVKLNQEQLQKGLQADDTPTGEYSTTSVEVYGKSPGPINLYNTGDFYNSMKTVPQGTIAVIEGDTIKTVADYKDKGLTVDLLDRWPKALGLDEESKAEIRPLAQQIVVDEVRKALAA